MEVIKILDSKDVILFEKRLGVFFPIEFFSKYLIVKFSAPATCLEFFIRERSQMTSSS